MEEIWKKHPVYMDYESSNLGRIRRGEKIYKQTINTNGYCVVGINKKTKLAHRFIYECFYGVISQDMCIDHINTNRTDNSIDNLRLCTYEENMDNILTRKHLHHRKDCHHILQYEKGTKNIVAWYYSKREAAEATHYTTNYIRKYCTGKQNCRKYDWEQTDKFYTCKWGKWWETLPDKSYMDKMEDDAKECLLFYNECEDKLEEMKAKLFKIKEEMRLFKNSIEKWQIDHNYRKINTILKELHSLS